MEGFVSEAERAQLLVIRLRGYLDTLKRNHARLEAADSEGEPMGAPETMERREKEKPTMTTSTEVNSSTVQIDETIGQLESMYRAMTGKDVPNGEIAYAPIPAEKDPAIHVEEQLTRLLDMLGSPGPAPQAPAWTPPVSIWENDSEIVFCLDLPGVSRERVDVSMQGNLLTISGIRPAPATSDLWLRASERPLGPFRRTVVLPPGVQYGEPTAQLRDGVLEVRIRKEPLYPSTPKSVPVS